VRAYVAELDSEVMGFAGVAYTRAGVWAFADMRDSAQKYPMTIMRVARKVKTILAEITCPVYCEADAKYPNAGELLKRVGFKSIDGRYYIWQRCP